MYEMYYDEAWFYIHNNYQPYLEFPLNLMNLVQVHACRHKLTKYYIVT